MSVEGFEFVGLLILLLTFFTQDKGVKLLQIRGSTQDKYALSLIDVLFDDEEMANNCFGTTKSTKPSLPKERSDLIKGMNNVY